MPRVIIFQHSPSCSAGTIAGHLKADGAEPTIIKFYAGDQIPDLDQFNIMIVLGGTMDVWEEDAYPWLREEKAAIRHWVKNLDRPYFGVCLGHQLLADSLGGEVGPASACEFDLAEISLSDEGMCHRLFEGVEPVFRGVQWHCAEVKRLPVGATCLASSPQCRVAAMSYGSAAFGLQYHIEASEQSIHEWADPDASRAALARQYPANYAVGVQRRVSESFADILENSRRVYDNFMHVAIEQMQD
ncbi:type 1 glutamine amidotransferase [Hyphomicrobium sp. D-2]|uniref:type 1 glutamine amidotransferase n=1 Tax=Hyphomicrobium sp. D-2 TaxID=3041621 RepID=UPI002455AD65|nr:type 1 glutamine amidotransferase [Hyphomicrobium sp. D-2]MDH4983838.1 type 1 glutamine amidotransferase [Hyphomicrobium sp. D-2]